MSHGTLENYFKIIFSMTYHHGYSITDIENLIPFERDVYVEILKDYVERKEEQARQQNVLLR